MVEYVSETELVSFKLHKGENEKPKWDTNEQEIDIIMHSSDEMKHWSS